MSESFVHLHVHSEYSLLDGATRLKDLVKQAHEFGMPAVALTDHGNLYGAVEFHMAAKKVGIKPIIGCEVYLAPGHLSEKKDVPGQKPYSLLTLLVTSEGGYHNLVKIVSQAHLDGVFHHKPRTDKRALAQYSEGLICLSGGMNGEICQAILEEDMDRARASLRDFREIFGEENFFLELQDHGLEPQIRCREGVRALSAESGVRTVATNDVHFLRREDHDAHDLMICIGSGSLRIDEKRLHYPEEVYLKSSEEMRTLFADDPGSCDLTLEIAERCNFEMELDATSIARYPKFDPPGEGREECFRRLCEEGLIWRYGEEAAKTDQVLRDRLEGEIAVMQEKGFVSYFLIVRDFINWAREQKIPVGPGRGSAAGSLVSYVLGITNICPIRFGLIFERFLNPERVSPPDIDIDFCQTRRPEVIEYVRQKYGTRAVSHIITFGKMLARSAVRDVGRVLGWSYGDTDIVAKMIPQKPGKPIKLNEAREMNPELEEKIITDVRVEELWRYACFLEGLTRNAGIHAAGVVIGDGPIDVHVPLTLGSEGETVTQYAMKPLTELGMLKMDFLGLKTLTVIQDAVDLIREHTPDFDVETLPLDNAKTFEMIRKAETVAVFQLESTGMANTAKQFGVDRIEDIIALVSIYRPGPMDLIPSFVARKHGREEVTYLHPLLEAESEESFGILIYQEQVMKAANLLGGYSLGEADLLRRAMGKKDLKEMARQRARFVDGCEKLNQIPVQEANDIFDLLEKFAGYGFNKSHAAAYALVAYHTAYLKANYPLEFMAAILSNEVNNTEKLSSFVAECRRMEIRILPPDVNRSGFKFLPEELPEGGRAIRYGLSGVKNVGSGAVELIIRERKEGGEFRTMEDFSLRLDTRTVNRKGIESLVKAGAFDWTGERRWDLFARVDTALAGAAASQRDRKSGQASLFGDDELAMAPPSSGFSAATVAEPWSKDEMMKSEKELLGFYVTGHPLDAYRALLEGQRYQGLGRLDGVEASVRGERKGRPKQYAFAGLVTQAGVRYSRRNNKPFMNVVLEDFTGQSEMMLSTRSYEKCHEMFQVGQVVALKGYVEISGDDGERRQIMIDDARILPRPRANVDVRGALSLLVDTVRTRAPELEKILGIIRRHPGDVDLNLVFQRDDGKQVRMALPEKYRVDPDDTFMDAIAPWRP